MTGNILLFRQIHPSFVQNGFASSQAFRPTPKDEFRLSVYDGDQITAENSFRHYTEILNLASAGTMALTVDDCKSEDLEVSPDPLDRFPEHTIIDFSQFSPTQCEKKSKKLKAKATSRGWQYLASTN